MKYVNAAFPCAPSVLSNASPEFFLNIEVRFDLPPVAACAYDFLDILLFQLEIGYVRKHGFFALAPYNSSSEVYP